MINITETPMKDLVEMDTGGVSEAQEGMIGETCGDSHCFGVHDGLMAYHGRCLMTMDDANPFPEHNLSENRETTPKRREGDLARGEYELTSRHMVNLHPICHVSDPSSISIGTSDHNHLVTPRNEALPEHIDVTFYPTHTRIEEVTHEGDVVLHCPRISSPPGYTDP